MQRLGPWLFRLASWFVSATYGRFPIFGELRSAAGIILQGEALWMVERSDGRGRCFPGGVAHFRESEESTLRREIEEETGLRVSACRLLWRYHNRIYIPSQVAVYQVEAAGKPRDSWEGRVQLVPLAQVRDHLFPIHAPIADFLERNGTLK